MHKIAVVGATGNVGREVLQILADRNFPAEAIIPLASRDSMGKELSYGDNDTLKVKSLDEYNFKDTHIAIFSAGSAVSERFAPKAAEAGCVVIDNTSFFRMKDDIPLVVPEVNPEAIADFRKRNIIANPNCSTIQMVVALKPLHDHFSIKRIVVSTYQSVSGAGKEAMDELFNQTKGMFIYQEPEPRALSKRIAFNLIPFIDIALPNGSSKEEWKMEQETKKILDPSIHVVATCVRVPVFVGHSLAVNIEFEDPFTVEEAKKILMDASGLIVIDRPGPEGAVTPIECVGEDAVFVSRIRKDNTVAAGLNLWIVADNLRKGAALNAIQIAELLINDYL